MYKRNITVSDYSRVTSYEHVPMVLCRWRVRSENARIVTVGWRNLRIIYTENFFTIHNRKFGGTEEIEAQSTYTDTSSESDVDVEDENCVGD